jgi:hypothetical protein
MEKPTPPADYECCESGCDPCVWDTYNEELATFKAFEAKQNMLNEQANSSTPDE